MGLAPKSAKVTGVPQETLWGWGVRSHRQRACGQAKITVVSGEVHRGPRMSRELGWRSHVTGDHGWGKWVRQ